MVGAYIEYPFGMLGLAILMFILVYILLRLVTHKH